MTPEKALTRHSQDYLPARITTEQAMYLLKTIWPKAPEAEVIKAGILCQQYGLNPLMRQVYLIKFGEEWVTVLGIKATRQIAQQALRKLGILYSYLDGPRVMSEKEQIKIRGKVEADKLWAITILADGQGNTFPGYGFWPSNKQPYGIDKGNDALNMAFIRSERNALEKLAPGELPDIEVGDDASIEGDFKEALEEGKRQVIKEAEKDIEQFWPEGKSVAKPVPEPTLQSPNKPLEQETSDIIPSEGNGLDYAWVKEMVEKLGWMDVGKYLVNKYHVTGKRVSELVAALTPEQAVEFEREIQDRLLMR